MLALAYKQRMTTKLVPKFAYRNMCPSEVCFVHDGEVFSYTFLHKQNTFRRGHVGCILAQHIIS